MSALDTLPKLLAHNAAHHGGEVALREKQFGIWRSLTWGDYQERTRAMALGLRHLGIGAGDVIGLIGRNG
jgi:long-chain acyl-CoA synthetase